MNADKGYLLEGQHDAIRIGPKRPPSVSVVIPTYNRAVFVVKAVESVLNQTFTDYELIVVDDGSTDSTKGSLDKYGDKVTYIKQSNSGVSAARNAGIAVSRGKWLAFLDSDDEWKPEYLATQIRRADTIAGLCMQATNCRLTYDNEGLPQTYFELNGAMASFKEKDYVVIEEPLAFVVTHQPWQVGSIIFRRDAAINAGLFDTSLTLHEDIDFVARVSLQGRFGVMQENLVDIHRRDEQTERLTKQAKRNPFEAQKSHDRIYHKIRQNYQLRYKEQKALNKVMSANRRAMEI